MAIYWLYRTCNVVDIKYRHKCANQGEIEDCSKNQLCSLTYQQTTYRHMAADEMREITSDKWSDEIWGIASSSSASSPMSASTASSTPAKASLNLVLYFAQQDHWVAGQTRDEIIRARGGMVNGTGSNGPSMLVCEDGVVHGFCIREYLFLFSFSLRNLSHPVFVRTL